MEYICCERMQDRKNRADIILVRSRQWLESKQAE